MLSGVAARTIRLYLQRAVLPRPPFMGSATQYQRRHLVHLLAIRRLRAEKLTLAAIRTRLQALAAPDLEAFATENLPAGPIADALGIRVATPPSASTSLGLAPPTGGGSLSSTPIPRWARVELALGLELHVRDDASVRVLELAQRLRDLCAAGR